MWSSLQSLFTHVDTETQGWSNLSKSTLLKSSRAHPCPPAQGRHVLGCCALEVLRSIHTSLINSSTVLKGPSITIYRRVTVRQRRSATRPGHTARRLGCEHKCVPHHASPKWLSLAAPRTQSSESARAPPEGRKAESNLLCNSSLVKFKVSFGDILAGAPVPDFCVFTRLFLPIFWLQRKKKRQRKALHFQRTKSSDKTWHASGIALTC